MFYTYKVLGMNNFGEFNVAVLENDITIVE